MHSSPQISANFQADHGTRCALLALLKGMGNELKGALKQDLGKETNDPDLVAEGEADQAKGKTQQVVGTVKNAVQEIANTVKR